MDDECEDDAELLSWEPVDEDVDPEDPYAGQDVEALPVWWRDAITEFRAHELPPYRPARFSDGVRKYRVEEALENAFDVAVDVLYVESRGHWAIRVDHEPIVEIGRHRDPAGYSVFEMESRAFAECIIEHVRNGRADDL